MENDGQGKVIQSLDLIDVLTIVGRRNRKYQAIVLNELETILDKNSREFSLVRKLFLDSFNDYTRSVLRIIFGDIEFDRYKK